MLTGRVSRTLPVSDVTLLPETVRFVSLFSPKKRGAYPKSTSAPMMLLVSQAADAPTTQVCLSTLATVRNVVCAANVLPTNGVMMMSAQALALDAPRQRPVRTAARTKAFTSGSEEAEEQVHER